MNILAADLGATSGRVMLGTVEEDAGAGARRIELTQLCRFPNHMLEKNGHKVWDFEALVDNILQGVANCPVEPDSFAVDSWAVDYGYLDAEGRLLGDTIAYRDPRTNRVMERVLREVPDLYMRNGIQVMPFNTIFQVIEDLESRPEIVERAARILLLPDLVNKLFTGQSFNEYSVCSSTALLDMRTTQWDARIMARYGIRADLFGSIAMPGRVIGPALPAIAARAGRQFTVSLTAGHDTGSAIAGIPVMPGRKWGYISSGTWSLVGVELPAPVINETSARFQITNEGGAEQTIRFLKNVQGMWLIEECLRDARLKDLGRDFNVIAQAAREAAPFRSLIDPTDPRFQAPAAMLDEIQGFCRETGQPAPETIGQIARCIYESLALRYREVFEEIAQVTGQSIDEIHIVGGGSRNDLLNQMTADATNKRVVRGPAEATVMGNIAIQAIALGVYKDLADYRAQQSAASVVIEYLPDNESAWKAANSRFQEIRLRERR